MRVPDAIWSAIYSHSRRTHRHRCRCCSKIIDDGQNVVMARVVGAKTWAIHETCATKPFFAMTWRDAMECWGQTYLRAIGYKIPPHPLESATGGMTHA